MGRDANAESFPALRQALHAAARLSGLARGAGHRRIGLAHGVGRLRRDQRLSQGRYVRPCGVQRPEGHVPVVGWADAAAAPRRRSRSAGVDVAAGRLPARARRGRYARHRRAGEQMQVAMNELTASSAAGMPASIGGRSRMIGIAGRAALLAAILSVAAAACPAAAYTVYVSNEKGNSITVLDSKTLEVLETIPVGQRPRGIKLTNDDKYLLVCASDDDTVQVVDVATREIVGDLPSGPDPELLNLHPSGSPVYIANEDDNLLTVIDLAGKKVLAEVEVGVEPEGVGVSPDGKTVVVTSETSNMAHFVDSESFEITDNVLVGSRPRFAEFTADGKIGRASCRERVELSGGARDISEN